MSMGGGYWGWGEELLGNSSFETPSMIQLKDFITKLRSKKKNQQNLKKMFHLSVLNMIILEITSIIGIYGINKTKRL